MAARTVHGARALVRLTNSGTNEAKPVGIWNSVNFSVSYDVNPVFILGRFSAAELVTTGLEPVSISCSGYRVVDHGPMVEGGFLNVTDLLNQGDITLDIYDRQTGKVIATIVGVKPTGLSSNVSAKNLMDSSTTYVGLLLSDESQTQFEEGPLVATLPG